MAKLELDTSHWPLLVSTLPARWTSSELDDYFTAFLAVHDREQPFVHISDISLAEPMSSPDIRKKAATFMASERARSTRLCKGTVQVAPGNVMRGAITAIHWLSPPPYPHAVVATFNQALAWCEQRATEAGLSLPPVPPRR